MPEIICASIYRLHAVFHNNQNRMAIRTRLQKLHPVNLCAAFRPD